MTGCTNNFNASRMRCMIGFSSNKCRQKRVMNVDDSLRIGFYETGRKNLHISGQNNKIYVVLFKKLDLFFLLLFFSSCSDWDVDIRNSKLFHYLLHVWVVTYDQWNFSLYFSTLITC